MFEKRELIFRSTLFLILLLGILIIISSINKYNLDKSFYFIIPVLMFLTVLFGWINSAKYQRSKKLGSKIESLLLEKGLILISERALNCKEIMKGFDPKPTVFINNNPINQFRYVSINTRILIVKNKKEEKFKLNVNILKKWNKKYRLVINDTIPLG